MTIIEITPLSNGAHRNQTVSGHITPPDGWAVIPAGMELPNFPFGTITVDDSTPPVVTSWTAGELPEPEPEPEPQDDVWTALDNAYQSGYTEGVNAV